MQRITLNGETKSTQHIYRDTCRCGFSTTYMTGGREGDQRDLSVGAMMLPRLAKGVGEYRARPKPSLDKWDTWLVHKALEGSCETLDL